MKYKILIFYLSILINLTIQRHLLIKSIRTSSNLLPIFNSSSINKSSFFNTTKLTTKSIKTIPFYLIKKPIKKFKKLTNSDSKFRIVESSSNKIEHFIEPNNVNNLDKDNNVIIIDDNVIDNDAVKKINIDEQLTPTLISNEEDEKLIAKRLDDINLMRKLGGLASITSLLSTSQRRISPLNKIILGLLGPKLVKLQLDMMFGAIISELIRKLLMPVLGFVVDKNLPASMQTMQQNQVPYSSNNLEQLQNAYSNLQTSLQSTTQSTTQSPVSNQPNYVNHPSYSTGYQTTSSATQSTNNMNTNPYVYYGQAQLANYLSSQSQQLAKSSSQEQSIQPTTAPTQNQLTSQQLNQLINQYANSINQHANQQQQTNQQQQNSQISEQNNQLYQQLQNLILEQVKLKNQLEQLAKPRHYFEKDMQLDTETKEDYQNEDELKDASLNQIEQEYDRAKRWNSVLKNMDHYNETLSIK